MPKAKKYGKKRGGGRKHTSVDLFLRAHEEMEKSVGGIVPDDPIDDVDASEEDLPELPGEDSDLDKDESGMSSKAPVEGLPQDQQAAKPWEPKAITFDPAAITRDRARPSSARRSPAAPAQDSQGRSIEFVNPAALNFARPHPSSTRRSPPAPLHRFSGSSDEKEKFELTDTDAPFELELDSDVSEAEVPRSFTHVEEELEPTDTKALFEPGSDLNEAEVPLSFTYDVDKELEFTYADAPFEHDTETDTDVGEALVPHSFTFVHQNPGHVSSLADAVDAWMNDDSMTDVSSPPLSDALTSFQPATTQLKQFILYPRLPDEVRQKILAYLVPHPRFIRPIDPVDSVFNHQREPRPIDNCPPLELLVEVGNRTFSADVAAAFYGSNLFFLTEPEDAKRWLTTIARNIPLLRQILFKVSDRVTGPNSNICVGGVHHYKLWGQCLSKLVKGGQNLEFFDFEDHGLRIPNKPPIVPGSKWKVGEKDFVNPLFDFRGGKFRFHPTNSFWGNGRFANGIIRTLMKFRGIEDVTLILGHVAGNHWDDALESIMKMPRPGQENKEVDRAAAAFVLQMNRAWLDRKIADKEGRDPFEEDRGTVITSSKDQSRDSERERERES